MLCKNSDKLEEGDAVTEQEAEAFAERLTRIWESFRPSSAVAGDGSFSYWGQIACDETSATYLDVTESPNHLGLYRIEIMRLRGGNGKGLGQMAYDPDENWIEVYTKFEEEDKKSYAQFATEWMPFFRRNCWLSGCPIEASAHEKAEWIQGFTREELQAWNLS